MISKRVDWTTLRPATLGLGLLPAASGWVLPRVPSIGATVFAQHRKWVCSRTPCAPVMMALCVFAFVRLVDTPAVLFTPCSTRRQLGFEQFCRIAGLYCSPFLVAWLYRPKGHWSGVRGAVPRDSGLVSVVPHNYFVRSCTRLAIPMAWT